MSLAKKSQNKNLAPLAQVLWGEELGVRGIPQPMASELVLLIEEITPLSSVKALREGTPHPPTRSPDYRGEGRFKLSVGSGYH